MTVLQNTIPEKKELGVTVKKVDQQDAFAEKIKKAVKEVKDIKSGKLEAKDFDGFLNEL